MMKFFSTLAASACLFCPSANAGLIAGFYDFAANTPNRDSTPNLVTSGVSASMNIGQGSPQSGFSSLTATFTSSGGSADKNYGPAGSTGIGDNGNNGFIESRFGPGAFAFLELINTSAAPLMISRIVFDAMFIAAPIPVPVPINGYNLNVSGSRRAANNSVLSAVSTTSFAPSKSFDNYTASFTGITLAPSEKLMVDFRVMSNLALWRLDNIAVDGQFAALTAVPETSTLLGLGAFFGLASSARFRRRPAATAKARGGARLSVGGRGAA